MWNGRRVTEKFRNADNSDFLSRCKGSATIEAAVVLPVFLIVLFSLAYIVRIFMAYKVMQSSLQNVARNISAAGYFYHVSGLKEYADKLNELGQKAEDELNDQKDTIIGTIDSFNALISGITDPNPSVDPETRIASIRSLKNELSGNISNAADMIKGLIKDPKEELKLLLTVFARKAAYAARKETVCMIARVMLDDELDKRADAGLDARKILGINDINFDQTQVFGDNESLELIITYDVKPPFPFSILPELTLCNRVKVIGWTSGRGQSVREEKDESGSIWVRMDTENRYWDRGLSIEEAEVEKLRAEAGNMKFEATSKKYPAVDAYIYDENTIKMYDVFTLNPFMKTYQNQPGRIKSEIKKHGKRLLEFEPQDRPEIMEIPNRERIVIVIFPENAKDAVPNIEECVSAAEAELKKLGITEVRVRYDYGTYTEKTGENDENRTTEREAA